MWLAIQTFVLYPNAMQGDKTKQPTMNPTKAALLMWLLLAAPPAANAQFTYATNAGAIAITGYTGSGGAVAIPASANGLPVTSIADYAFAYATNLDSLTVADSVTNVGEYAFYGCSNLAGVTITNAAASLGNFAFADCTSLASVTIPGSLANASAVFYGCSNLADVTIADGSTNVAANEFAFYFASLASVTLPDSVANIESNAFEECVSLAGVTIPASVTNIGQYAFYGCSNLAGVVVSNSAANFGNFAFAYCASLASATIPGSLTNAAAVFYGCANLANVTISDGSTSVVTDEFAVDFTSLASVTLPDSVASIGANAFYGCVNLASVALPGSVTNIGQSAFYECSNLASVDISNSAASLGNFAFADCASLASATVPGSLTNAGAVFYGCANLASLTISDGSTNVVAEEFASYFATLTSVTFPASVTSIGEQAFYGCSNLAGLTVSNGLASIGMEAFIYCTSLASVTLPGSVTNIGPYAFYACASLSNLMLLGGVASIGTNAFAACSNLAGVEILGGGAGFGYGAFAGCPKLAAIFFEGNAPASPASDLGVFYEDSVARVYYLPGATGWGSSFAGLPATVLNRPSITAPPANVSEPAYGTARFSVKATGGLLHFQWLFDGAPLSNSGHIFGSATGELTVNSILATNAGSYSVIITNYAGAETSSPARLVVITEKTRPSVAIASPKAGSRTNAPVLSGTASDTVRVLNVAYWLTNVNNGATNIHPGLASLTAGTGAVSNWTVPAAQVLPGTNYLAVRSSNYAGLASPIVSVSFFYKAPALFRLATGGAGKVTGSASVARDVAPANGALLNIGEGYTLTAHPSANFLLTNWVSASFTKFSPALSFIMETNLAITANFATNLFVGMAGRYDGIFYPSASPGPVKTNSGMIGNLVLKTNGAYSGKLYLAGTATPLAGAFNTSGQTTEALGRIAAAGGNVTLQLNVLFQSAPSPRQITGMVEGTGWMADHLNLCAATTNLGNAPNYTVLMPEISSLAESAPPNYGYALVTNTGSMLNLGGMLSDGTPFSLSAPINEQNEFPVYASLYGNAGLLLGTMSLTAGESSAAPNSAGMAWIKPKQATGLYAKGFSAALSVAGSPWTNSPAVLTNLFPTGAELTFSGGGLASNLVCTVQFSPSNTLERVSGSTNFILGSINRANGLMTVTFANDSGKKVTASGALLQNTAQGGGFFLGAANAGTITLAP
jgi:hypothetical protein